MKLWRERDLGGERSSCAPQCSNLKGLPEPVIRHIPISICEDVHVVIANVTILIGFVILEKPEDDNMSIILGKPFLNNAGVVIDCNKSKVSFHINGNEYTAHFRKKQFQVTGINIIEKSSTLPIGRFQLPLPTAKNQYDILIVGDVHIPVEAT